MRILVTFAIRAEFSPWSSRHTFVPYEFENWERRREFDLFKANIGRDEVTVLLTGIGPASAARAIGSIPFGLYDFCISSGLAGSLSSSIVPGDVVVSRSAEFLDGKGARGVSDAQLVELAAASGAKPVEVSLTAERIIATANEKELLAAKGSIVDMESAQILAVANECQVPCVVVRTVSDSSDEDLPLDFGRVLDTRGNLRIGGLIREVGLSPYRIPLLIQFGRQSRAAAKSLADFLDRFLEKASRFRPAARVPYEEEVSAT
ncbi:MAG TPA: hypothetical protein VJN93_09370 [Candidatus Acidoferrum sp.]|nr:hypothetical protein [Candidatus Acidoferrum sp.]